jgi:hypothetical protein
MGGFQIANCKMQIENLGKHACASNLHFAFCILHFAIPFARTQFPASRAATLCLRGLTPPGSPWGGNGRMVFEVPFTPNDRQDLPVGTGNSPFLENCLKKSIERY